MKHISGINLSSFTDPIREALKGYQWQSGCTVEFDLSQATSLELTPDKPNAARSATIVKFLGERAATLYVIAFRPGDGTGDENTYNLRNLDTTDYPRNPKIVPRSKKAVHTEAHLTLASFAIDRPDADPVLHAGNQTVLGLQGSSVVKIGEVGQGRRYFQSTMDPAYRSTTLPRVTYTCGYKANGQRFGDPHVIYNDHPEYVQVCGFLALPEGSSPEKLRIFEELRVLTALGDRTTSTGLETTA